MTDGLINGISIKTLNEGVQIFWVGDHVTWWEASVPQTSQGQQLPLSVFQTLPYVPLHLAAHLHLF